MCDWCVHTILLLLSIYREYNGETKHASKLLKLPAATCPATVPSPTAAE